MEENENEELNNEQENSQEEKLHEVLPVSGLYQNWFLEYASYVILERAVPAIQDGLKPVQRRILHSMKEMDDGRFNKVANVIGHSMQYHPHGDAAIGEAIVNLGQKDLVIETQGNWGDIRTGDSAAAPRYIEARLSKFALEVAFNGQTTHWQASYDGRRQEPITLPMKFPLLLAQGVEGIAVGLATKVMPHNFIEILEASIDLLKGKQVNLMPDFLTGGLADFSNYNEGKKGGKIRVRAKIEEFDKKTLLIKEIPYGTTTGSLIDSILKANDSGKIKIKKVIDNTAKDLEIEIQLAPGSSPDKTIDALYAFTDCEVSISPNACVIIDDKPHFIGVNDILKYCTHNTVELLKRELEIEKGELEEKWHFSSLEKIFIENRIYRDIEECETWDEIIQTIDKGLEPFKKNLKRTVTVDDITRLTEIRIKRISKFDAFKADEYIRGLEEELKQVEHHLAHLVDYAIAWFKNLLKKYSKGRERRTQIRAFDSIEANVVAIANQKLYVNRKEGFVGYNLKKDEYVCDCSDIDDIIVFRKDGKYLVTKVSEKAFVGKEIIHVDVFRKNDERMIYHVVYFDGKSRNSMVKRFNVTSVIRDKEYDLTKGAKYSAVTYFSANPNSEGEVVTVYLSAISKARNKVFDFDFADIAVKGRNSQGNILTKHPVRKISFKSKGASTLGGRDIWYDAAVGRLNGDGFGQYIGKFNGDDHILVIYKDGNYELTNYEFSNHYDPTLVYSLNKFRADKPITALYYDAPNKTYYVKRFNIETSTIDKKFLFIPEGKGSHIILATLAKLPEIELTTKPAKGEKKTEVINIDEFVEVRGWKAIGNKIAEQDFVSAVLVETEEQGEPEEETQDPEDGKGDDNQDQETPKAPKPKKEITPEEEKEYLKGIIKTEEDQFRLF